MFPMGPEWLLFKHLVLTTAKATILPERLWNVLWLIVFLALIVLKYFIHKIQT